MRINREGWTKNKQLAKLVANKNKIKCLLGFLKLTKVGGNE